MQQNKHGSTYIDNEGTTAKYMLMEFPHDSTDFPRPIPHFFDTLDKAVTAMLNEAANKSSTSIEMMKLSYLGIPGFGTLGCEAYGCLAFYAIGDEDSWCDWCLYEISICGPELSASWADTSPVEEELTKSIETLIETARKQQKEITNV